MNYTKENGISFKILGKYKNSFPLKRKRYIDVLYWRTKGVTLQEIADILKVTKERVRQMEGWAVEYIKSLERQKVIKL